MRTLSSAIVSNDDVRAEGWYDFLDSFVDDEELIACHLKAKHRLQLQNFSLFTNWFRQVLWLLLT
ncbi:hypothetical protein [Ensifer aridi]|uniref:hypothetical protein n=1 Tax=Ensifer aridi TaxID=1708715 RepID=UPI0009BD9623|nr:hypothetical protein [Ensifer aridi]